MYEIKIIMIVFSFSYLLISQSKEDLKPVLKKVLSEDVISVNPKLKNYLPAAKIEVGIESIVKEEEYYIIGVYAINPFDEIAGIQIQIFPEDLFYVEAVYGGRTKNKDFSMHFNKKGTILGISMTGDTIEPTQVVSYIDKKNKNILFYVKALPNKLMEYIKTKELMDISMDIVIASKKGKTLTSRFIPFSLYDIQYKK